MLTPRSALALATSPAKRALQNSIEAKGPEGPLRGRLTSGGGSTAPTVLIIPGSGPTDCDGDSPLGVRAAPYRLLAQELASQGVTTVRIDKRGMFGSAGAMSDANAVTIADYVRDVHVWVDALREKTGCDGVWLLGHSEGGLVALAAAQKGAHIRGLVLAATPGRPLGEVLKDQLRANAANAPLLDQAMTAIDALAAGRRVDAASLPPALLPLFHNEVQGFLISVFALDPATLIGGIRKPVLILQGERDLQVSVADAERLKAAALSATLTLLPDTNHVLKRIDPDDRDANIAAYADPTLPLAPHVAEYIARFIKAAGRER